MQKLRAPGSVEERAKRIRHQHDDEVRSSRGRGETFASLMERRISRRGLLKAGAGAAGVMVLSTPALGRVIGPLTRTARAAGSVKFVPIPPAPEDAQQIVVAEGHGWAPFLKWGDPIMLGAPDFDPSNLSREAQEMQFGYNCDYIGWHPLPWNDDASSNGSRALLLVNHEYTNAELMWPGYDVASSTVEQADVEMAAHGASIVEVMRGNDGRMVALIDSAYNRRITATTPIMLSGPAAGHPWLQTASDPWGNLVEGMLNNCAGGYTPWGTFLTAEENFQGYFGNLSNLPEDDPRYEVHDRYGVEEELSGYGWERHYPRFNVAVEPNEPFRFGWVVEIDPYDPTSLPVKRTALGRMKHEGATFGWSPSGRVVFYSGDDQRFDYVYKYVSTDAYDPLKRGMNQELLDDGTLYVARFNDDGSGEWLPLLYGEAPLNEENGFTSQGDVLIKTRLAADALGATKMDRPEDMQQNPVNHKIYAVMTNNNQRTEEDVDTANPRADNVSGHIIEITEADDDAASETFTWDIFLLCGDPSDESTYFAGFPKELVSPIACPDNVNFDAEGNLWITTDGQPTPLGNADGFYAVPTEGPQRGFVAQFLSVVNGAECAGNAFTPDNLNAFISVQHPGEGGTFEEPISLWPDGGPVTRPTVIQVWNESGERIGGGAPLSPWSD